MKATFFAVLLLLATRCNGATPADYLGVWQNNSKPVKTYEIRKDGESYFLQNLRATTLTGQRQGPTPLTVKDGRLVWSTGTGELPLALTADKQTLVFSSISLDRVVDGQRLKKEIEAEYAQRNANKSQCDALGREMKARDSAINASNTSATTKMSEKTSLKAEMNRRSTAIPDCKAMLLLF
jgi:hypothetical protein